MPNVSRAALYPVGMQIGEPGVVAIAVERRLRLPLHEDEHLPRVDLADHRVAKLAERDDPPAVRLHLFRRAARDLAHASPQMACAASTHSFSLARSSASVTGLPPMLLAKPHCGLMARRDASTYRAASSARRRSSSSFSSVGVLELTRPSTTPLSFGR